MSAADTQIITCYETLGLTPEQIAEQFQLELTAVKFALFQNSQTYREKTQQKPNEDFNDQDLDMANTVIRNLAQYADDDNLRFRAAKYLRDDKKGRKDVAKNGLRTLNVTLLEFSAHLEQANKQLALSRANGLSKPANGDRKCLDNIKEAQTIDV